jgi:hypothetical protein
MNMQHGHNIGCRYDHLQIYKTIHKKGRLRDFKIREGDFVISANGELIEIIRIYNSPSDESLRYRGRELVNGGISACHYYSIYYDKWSHIPRNSVQGRKFVKAMENDFIIPWVYERTDN